MPPGRERPTTPSMRRPELQEKAKTPRADEPASRGSNCSAFEGVFLRSLLLFSFVSSSFKSFLEFKREFCVEAFPAVTSGSHVYALEHAE